MLLATGYHGPLGRFAAFLEVMTRLETAGSHDSRFE
jgi:hypothetical protein